MRYRMLLMMASISFIGLAASSPARAADQVETKSQAIDSRQAAPANPPLTPEQQTLVSIQEEGEQRVAAVLRSMDGMTQGPALEALQAQIIQIKKDTYVRFLAATAEFARARGDEAAAREAERIIEQILHPKPPAEPSEPQPRDKEGGRQ